MPRPAAGGSTGATPKPTCCDHFVNLEKISLDIGANDGMFTGMLAEHSKECIAFEPVPWLAERVKQKCKKPNVIVYDCALSDSDGEITLRIPLSENGEKPQNASLREMI